QVALFTSGSTLMTLSTSFPHLLISEVASHHGGQDSNADHKTAVNAPAAHGNWIRWRKRDATGLGNRGDRLAQDLAVLPEEGSVVPAVPETFIHYLGRLIGVSSGVEQLPILPVEPGIAGHPKEELLHNPQRIVWKIFLIEGTGSTGDISRAP